MVDVLGISLVRLLAVCNRNEYDKIPDSVDTLSKNANNPTDRITREAIRRMRESVPPVAFSGGVFKNLVSRYQQLERGEGTSRCYQCPTHGTWLQQEDKPFPHYSCWFWKGCTYKKDAVANLVTGK
jgi:hypothetical protein